MIKLNKILKSIAFQHVAVWLFVMLYSSLSDPLPFNLKTQIISLIFITTANATAFYTHNYLLLPRLWHNKFYYAISLLLGMAVFFGMDYLNFEVYIGYAGYENPLSYMDKLTLFFSESIQYLIIVALAFTSYHNRASRKKLEQQLDAEKKLLTGDLSFFKNQFNDHVVFNFLNYCYAHANKTSPETASIIAQYAEMTRYTMQVKSDEETALENEVKYLENFISLKQKLSEGGYVNFDVTGDVHTKKILPRMLITLVENAYKHGDAFNPEHPIQISLNCYDKGINFSVSNQKKKNGPKPISTSVGQKNMQNQLEKFYANKYKIETKDLADEYIITLNLYQ